MPVAKKSQKPVTMEEISMVISEKLAQFYTELIEPQFKKMVTLSQLADFYDRMIEPRFQKLEAALQEFRNESNQRFDDLYKKFETLHQEYIVICEQLKRMERHFVTREELQNALGELKAQVEALHERIEDLERRLLAQ